jgi:hypothetical protein
VIPFAWQRFCGRFRLACVDSSLIFTLFGNVHRSTERRSGGQRQLVSRSRSQQRPVIQSTPPVPLPTPKPQDEVLSMMTMLALILCGLHFADGVVLIRPLVNTAKGNPWILATFELGVLVVAIGLRLHLGSVIGALLIIPAWIATIPVDADAASIGGHGRNALFALAWLCVGSAVSSARFLGHAFPKHPASPDKWSSFARVATVFVISVAHHVLASNPRFQVDIGHPEVNVRARALQRFHDDLNRLRAWLMTLFACYAVMVAGLPIWVLPIPAALVLKNYDKFGGSTLARWLSPVLSPHGSLLAAVALAFVTSHQLAGLYLLIKIAAAAPVLVKRFMCVWDGTATDTLLDALQDRVLAADILVACVLSVGVKLYDVPV